MGFGWAAEDNVKIVTGESGKASYEERLKLIHGLGNDLSKKEIQRRSLIRICFQRYRTTLKRFGINISIWNRSIPVSIQRSFSIKSLEG